MPQDGLLRTQTDGDKLRRLIGFLAIGLIQFVIHSALTLSSPNQ